MSVVPKERKIIARVISLSNGTICRKSTRNTSRLQRLLRHVKLVVKIQCHCLKRCYPKRDVTAVMNKEKQIYFLVHRIPTYNLVQQPRPFYPKLQSCNIVYSY